MKKYSRKSKRTMKRSTRSKKMSRRRRQRGGGEIAINCTINPSSGAITATSSDPSFTVTPSTNTLVITGETPIKNIKFAKSIPAKVGSGSGIILQDLGDSKFVVPASSFMYSKTLTAAQKKLDTAVGMAFSKGVKVTGLNAGNLGISTDKVASGATGIAFVLTITT